MIKHVEIRICGKNLENVRYTTKIVLIQSYSQLYQHLWNARNQLQMSCEIPIPLAFGQSGRFRLPYVSRLFSLTQASVERGCNKPRSVRRPALQGQSRVGQRRTHCSTPDTFHSLDALPLGQECQQAYRASLCFLALAMLN